MTFLFSLAGFLTFCQFLLELFFEIASNHIIDR